MFFLSSSVQLSDDETGGSAAQSDFASHFAQPVSGVYFEAADRGGFRGYALDVVGES